MHEKAGPGPLPEEHEAGPQAGRESKKRPEGRFWRRVAASYWTSVASWRFTEA